MNVPGERHVLYSDEPNPFILAAIPRTARRVLDVGCSTGSLGLALKQRSSACVVHGIESAPASAATASSRLDLVLEGRFPEAGPPPTERYDAIVLADVLEHVADPWGALSAAKGYLAPTGVIYASIPNVRYWPVSKALLLRGEWAYQDTGVLDRTHLRFFTASTMRELFASADLELVSMQPTFELPSTKIRLLERLLRVRDSGLRARQYLVQATWSGRRAHD